MKSHFHLVLVQHDIAWENPQANRDLLDGVLQRIETPADLVVLPEMFTTGFSMEPQRIAETMDKEMDTLKWMRRWAKQLEACITGSVSVLDGEQYYNRLFWVYPDGSHVHYDKRHTFTMAGEDKVYQRGSGAIVVEWQGWRIKPLICYDLRFPVWSKNRIHDNQAEYDLLVYVANWPRVRRDPWNKLLPARAIENQSYLGAVNRAGTDGNGLEYTGDSVILDARGNTLAALEAGQAGILHATLDAASLLDFREKFPVLFDDDDVM
jgi:omega-amidase